MSAKSTFYGRGSGGAAAAALPATNSLLKGNGIGGATAAAAGTDYLASGSDASLNSLTVATISHAGGVLINGVNITDYAAVNATYAQITGYLNVYNSFSVLSAYQHGVTMMPVANDGGLKFTSTIDGSDAKLQAGSFLASGPSRLGGSPTLSTLPSASSYNNHEENISNPAAGKAPKVISDGTHWLYMDGTIAV